MQLVTIDNIKKNKIDNAIKSMYQLIMLVNKDTLKYDLFDYNAELKNLSAEGDDFDVFCYTLYKNVHPGDRENFVKFTDPEYFPEILKEQVYTSLECRIRRVDRKYYWAKIIFCNATEEDKADGNDYLFMIQDIHDMKVQVLREEASQREILNNLRGQLDKLFEENMVDQQTGCYNRKGMKYYSDMVIAEAKATGKYLFVCVSDLNGLKFLNDTYGHAAGDEAIAAVAAELLNAAPKGTRIVRMGGDEFLLFAALDKDSTEPEEMNEKIDAGLDEYNKSHPNPFTIGASYGWVLLPVQDDMIDLDEYIEMADAKMYEMKVNRDEHRRS